jgi:hypothetical protein
MNNYKGYQPFANAPVPMSVPMGNQVPMSVPMGTQVPMSNYVPIPSTTSLDMASQMSPIPVQGSNFMFRPLNMPTFQGMNDYRKKIFNEENNKGWFIVIFVIFIIVTVIMMIFYGIKHKNSPEGISVGKLIGWILLNLCACSILYALYSEDQERVERFGKSDKKSLGGYFKVASLTLVINILFLLLL